MAKHMRRRRKRNPHGFGSVVPVRPYTAWDDPMGDYNPYALYEHPYKLKPESLKLYLKFILRKLDQNC
jgi:hypothetical protein